VFADFGEKRETVSRPTSGQVANNRLLDALPRQDRKRLLAASEQVDLKYLQVLREPGQRIRYVYFPVGSSISLIAPTAAGASLEVAVIGREGVFGVSVAFGIHVGSQRALVNTAGAAWRIAAAQFCREFERNPETRRLLSRYLYVVMAQLSQAAVCANFHDVGARLARWLLVAGLRAHSDRFYVTQENISSMLGVRRASINGAASLLQERKLIRYIRGHLTILDWLGLEAAACECYSAAKNAYLLQYPGVTRQLARKH
jgi:CRP-like cAMP-binding protein